MGEEPFKRSVAGTEIPDPPWQSIDRVRGGDYRGVGSALLHLFREVGNLPRNARLLNIGRGCGRMAVPLTGFLDEGES